MMVKKKNTVAIHSSNIQHIFIETPTICEVPFRCLEFTHKFSRFQTNISEVLTLPRTAEMASRFVL